MRTPGDRNANGPARGRFDHTIVLVTGAATGIGYAIAERFAIEGAQVVVTARSLQKARPAADKIRAATANNTLTAMALDQSNENRINLAFRQLTEQGGVDVVCINAAVALASSPLESYSRRDIDRILDTNLLGSALVARACIPALRKRGGGSIIFTSSVAALRGRPGAAMYAASKAGLLGLARSLALEVATDHIRVNSILPGSISTPMAAGLSDDFDYAVLEAARRIPLGRIGDAEEVAAAAAFLASDDARYITAAELVVDGGMAATLP